MFNYSGASRYICSGCCAAVNVSPRFLRNRWQCIFGIYIEVNATVHASGPAQLENI
jgi:hypothetical protein